MYTALRSSPLSLSLSSYNIIFHRVYKKKVTFGESEKRLFRYYRLLLLHPSPPQQRPATPTGEGEVII